MTGAPAMPGVASAVDAAGAGGITTCATYTFIGADGVPTVVDSTWVIPRGNGLPSMTNPGFPPVVSQATITGIPQPPAVGSAAGPVTAVTTAIIIGPDGKPTAVVQTVVIGGPGSGPQGTVTGIPLPVPSVGSAASPVTAVTTAIIIGPDGKPTPVVQTVVIGNPAGEPQGTVTGLPLPPPSGPAIPTGSLNPSLTGLPSLVGYGQGGPTLVPFPAASMSAIVSGGSADAISNVAGEFISGTITGTRTSTFTKVVVPTNGPVVSGGIGGVGGIGGSPPSYDDSLGGRIPAPGSGQLPDSGYGAVPSDITLWPAPSAYGLPPNLPQPGESSSCSTTLKTSTWANVITEETTSYTINFPLTTLVTLPAAKRMFRRQER